MLLADSYRWEQTDQSGRSGLCFQDAFSGSGGSLECRPRHYSSDHLRSLVELAQARQTRYYDSTDVYVYAALEALGGATALAGHRVAVIGSLEPWSSLPLRASALPRAQRQRKRERNQQGERKRERESSR